MIHQYNNGTSLTTFTTSLKNNEERKNNISRKQEEQIKSGKNYEKDRKWIKIFK